MKNLIPKGLILMLLLMATMASAQVKKTSAPAKTKKAAVAPAPLKNLAASVLNTNTEQASRLISNELKAIGMQIESMDEQLIYDVVKNDKQTGRLLQTRTSLVCSNRMQVDLFADPNDVILNVNWYLNDISHNDYLKIERLLGYPKWTPLTKSNFFSRYLFNNFVADVTYLGSGENENQLSYAINLSKIDRFVLAANPKPFNVDSLTVHSNPEEIGQSVVQFLKGQGFRFLYKSLKEVATNFEGDNLASAYAYTTTYVFDEGTSVTVKSNKYQKLEGINFSFDDPLLHNKIKRWFKFSNWKKEGEADDEGNELYAKGHLQCVNNDKSKTLEFGIAPAMNDIETRYQNTAPIAASSLINNYFNMEKEGLKDYITRSYVNMASVNWPHRKMTYNEKADPFVFYFKSPADSLCYVSYEYKLSDTWTRVAYFSTGDKAYFEKMKTDLTALAQDPKSKVIVNFSQKPFEKTGMHYIMVFSKAQEAVLAENKRKLAEEQLAQQQREKAAAAERARLKAEKDAKTAEDIQKVGDILIQGIQQMKKKGNN